MTIYTQEKFIGMCEELYGKDRYDFSKSVYRGSIQPIEVRCPHHGIFTVKKATYLLKGRACQKCSRDGGKLTYEQRVERIQNKFKGRVKLKSQGYILGTDKVMFECEKHGEYENTYNYVIHSKFGCAKCAKEAASLNMRTSHEVFKQRVYEKHGDLFIVDVEEYVTSVRKIGVLCSKHGFFITKPNDLYAYNPCPDCYRIKNERLYYERFPETNMYIMEMSSGDEKFLKVGVSVDVPKRAKYLRNTPYEVKVLRCIRGDSEYLYKAEQKLHRVYQNKHIPKESFGGMWECYKTSSLSLLNKLFDNFKGELANVNKN